MKNNDYNSSQITSQDKLNLLWKKLIKLVKEKQILSIEYIEDIEKQTSLLRKFNRFEHFMITAIVSSYYDLVYLYNKQRYNLYDKLVAAVEYLDNYGG